MDWLLIAIVLFVAFCNGANDNFKGFATVWGSDTLSYHQALAWRQPQQLPAAWLHYSLPKRWFCIFPEKV